MPWLGFKKNRGAPVEVHWADGPTWAGGAGLSVYVYADGTIETAEYDWFGREIIRYEGEPRDVMPGTQMPEPPPVYDPTKGEKPRPLPPLQKPPPWHGANGAPAAPTAAAPAPAKRGG